MPFFPNWFARNLKWNAMINLKIPGIVVSEANRASTSARNLSHIIFEALGKIPAASKCVEPPEFWFAESISGNRPTRRILHRDTFKHYAQLSHIPGSAGGWL